MANDNPAGSDFPHLPLLYRDTRPAYFPRGGGPDPRVLLNKNNRRDHSRILGERLDSLSRRWAESQQERAAAGLPAIESGIPFVVELGGGLELDNLVQRFKLEVVAEDWVDEGDNRRRYVLVAAERIADSDLLKLVAGFADQKRGSAGVASMLNIVDDPADSRRLEAILTPNLMRRWPFPDGDEFVLDVSFQTRGVLADLGMAPRKSRRESKDEHAKRKVIWLNEKRTERYRLWDDFTLTLKREVDQIITAHQGEVVKQWDNESQEDAVAMVSFPDSVSFRIRMSGAGFRDLILNHPRIFEVQEPEDASAPLDAAEADTGGQPDFELLPPQEGSPLVCVIDSGIQEGHRLLSPAIASDASVCLVPGKAPDDVADEVKDGGHGTSVAGAVLYPDDIPATGQREASCFIGNARVLDEERKLSRRLYPPAMLDRVVDHFQSCRLFVHSINAEYACPLRHMSAWAAKMDDLSYRTDALFVVSAGNVPPRQYTPGKGFLEHLEDGVAHPKYLLKDSGRIATPAQSLQAIAVGSIAHADFDDGSWVSIGGKDNPSAFTRAGLGIWDTLKPDVVEYGGDACVPKGGTPATTVYRPDVCPHTVRSTLHGGAETGKDKAGTSFAAPKVAALAAQLARQFPQSSTLLYRALIAQSARWPKWAEELERDERKNAFRMIGYGRPDWNRALQNEQSRVTMITSEALEIKAGEAMVFEVPVPEEIRSAGDDVRLRVDVTLSYVTEPRRTRASLKGYQAVWLDWRSSTQREPMSRFLGRIWADEETPVRAGGGTAIPWMLGFQNRQGLTREISRQGTLQKDWAHVPAFDLGDSFGIAVRGHKGWNQGDPAATAKFVLVVSFEADNPEVRVYEPVRVAIENRIRVSRARVEV